MYVSDGQFYVFIATLAFGGVCGVLFSVSALIKLKISNVFLRIVPDFIAFLIIAILYVFCSKTLNFPNFRIYMALGVIVGLILYFKSFHFLLAKCLKFLYNKCVRLLNNLKANIKLRNERKNGRIES